MLCASPSHCLTASTRSRSRSSDRPIAEEFGMQAADMMWVITASTVGMGIGAMGLGTRRQDWAQEGGHAGLGLLRRLLADRSACDIPGPDRLAAVPDWPGNGRYYPSLPALAAEYSPHKHRGTLMTVVLLGLRGGALLGGWVAAAWLSLVGWRGVFLIGGIAPMLLLLVCVVLLPESPGYWRLAGTQTQTPKHAARTNDRSNASRRHRPPNRGEQQVRTARVGQKLALP